MILASQANEFLIIAIIAIMVIAIGLLVYYVVTGKKKKTEPSISPNFEMKNNVVEQNYPEPVQEVNNFQENVALEETIPEPVNTLEVADTKTAEDERTDNNIQTLLNQMQQDLNKPTDNYADSISRYEDEEEENAIISYTELMKYKENREKEIVLEDKDKEEIKEVIKEEAESEKPKEEVKKFKRSEFISPIFGYNEDTNVTYREIKRPPRKEVKIQNNASEWESDRILKNLENDAAEVIEFETEEKEETSITKNDKFLDELVDFRNKLN